MLPLLLLRPPRPRPRLEDMLLLPGVLVLSTHRCAYSSTQHSHTDVCTHLHNTHTQMCVLNYTTLTHRCVYSSTQHSHTDVCTHLHNTHTQMCVLIFTTLNHTPATYTHAHARTHARTHACIQVFTHPHPTPPPHTTLKHFCIPYLWANETSLFGVSRWGGGLGGWRQYYSYSRVSFFVTELLREITAAVTKTHDKLAMRLCK